MQKIEIFLGSVYVIHTIIQCVMDADIFKIINVMLQYIVNKYNDSSCINVLALNN